MAPAPKTSTSTKTIDGEKPTELPEGTPGREVAVITTFAREQLAETTSFDAALALASQHFGTIVKADESTDLGDGFKRMTEDDKRGLVGSRLLFLDWRFTEGDYAEDYVVCHVYEDHGNGQTTKWLLTDSGKGLREELRQYERATGRNGGLLVNNGLRVSDYPTDKDTGVPLNKKQIQEYAMAGKKTGRGYTFYLDTSP